ncbi:MAG: MBL fold metallo-hydrolase [Nocardiaceae bacterium]|nr:MBL fold metallo-hydrolase [Nocardiaceae bacterium]
MATVCWWGHSFTTVRLGSMAVATDPLAATRLFHLRRAVPAPPPGALTADLVLISHLHHDHLHVPTLRQFGSKTPIIVPKGTASAIGGLEDMHLIEAEPGQTIEIGEVTIEVLPAHHDGRRLPHPRAHRAPALGFRFAAAGRSCWYPGDTGVQDFSTVKAVDLALVPIGGWGPTLGVHHLNPAEAAAALREVGARFAVPVHYGTFWPVGLQYLMRSNHDRLFNAPALRFRNEMAGADTSVIVPGIGETVDL